jgi:SAM-dependent methyltransferase
MVIVGVVLNCNTYSRNFIFYIWKLKNFFFMEVTMQNWKDIWNQKAETNHIFAQMGRRDYTIFQFFLMCRDMASLLKFTPDDIVLDAGAGSGWTSFYISPFVQEVTAFDFAENLVEIAKSALPYYPNLRVFQDDLLTLDKVSDRKYTKVIAGGCPFQYLKDYDEVKTALTNIYNVMADDGRLLINHVPDARYQPDKSDSLWFGREALVKSCRDIGFKICMIYSVNQIFTQGRYTFDLVVVK